MQLITASRLRDARACQRLHKFKYIDRYCPVKDADALRFGTLWHKAMEAWWLAPGDQRLEHALDTITGINDIDPFDLVRLQELLRGYHYRWCQEPFDQLLIEAKFDTPLINPVTGEASAEWRLGGRLDGIVKDTSGDRVLLLEHKTAGADISPGSDYWQKLRLDSQISIYFDGAAALGYPVKACLYDVVCKPGIRPLRSTPPESRKYTKDGRLYAYQREADETPEEYRVRLIGDIAGNPGKYYARGEIVRFERELDEARADVWLMTRQLRNCGEAMRNTDACLRFGSKCEFLPVCLGEASLDDPRMYRKLEASNPELTTQPRKEDMDGISH